MFIGGVVGALATPLLPSFLADAGIGVGIAGAGLLTSGFRARAIPMVVTGVAVGAVQKSADTKTFKVAEASVKSAAGNLRLASAGGSRSPGLPSLPNAGQATNDLNAAAKLVSSAGGAISAVV